MAELNTPTVIIGIAGGVLLYGAITNRNPIDVIKLTLSGGDITKARPLSTPGAGLFTQTVTGTPSADPSEMHSDGTPRAFPDGSPRYVNDPRPADLQPGDPRKVFKPIPAPGAPGDPRAPKDARR